MAIIGRETFADIVLPFPQVSARHALIEALGSGCFRVTDVGSANGTYVDGRRVTTAEIRTGADLRLGAVAFDWQAHRAVLDAEAALPPGMVLGRDPSCDLVVPDNRVSGRHLRVIPQGAGLLIMDLGSANGVTVNERPVARAVAQPSDKVRLGSLPLNLFSLVASRSAKTAAPPTPVWSVPFPLPPPVAPPPAPPVEVRPAPARKGGAPWVWGIAAVLVVAAAGVGLLFATREEIVKACELGPEEVFHEKAFFYQADEARARAQAIRWCPRHADEPVTVTRIRFCEICKKAKLGEDLVQVPRRENPHDFEVYEGICSEACRMDKLARDAASGAAGIVTDLADKLLQ
jgi:pSer/pThr/pTyr-binding forkhead associated (FHA) protein